LERSPEHIHTYRLTPLGLWNARAAGHDAESVVDALLRYSRYPVPHALLVDVAETMDRYGRLQLVNHPSHRQDHGAAHPRRALAQVVPGGLRARPGAAVRRPRLPGRGRYGYRRRQ